MSLIERVEERLSKHPELKYEVSGNMIAVAPTSPDGFSVSLITNSNEWIVYFDGWHEHFDIEDFALNCFAFGLSNQCRLEVTFRGTFPYRWTVQNRTENGWESDSTTGMFFFPFWRRRWIAYRQNDVSNPDQK